jgi:hypothetical protein
MNPQPGGVFRRRDGRLGAPVWWPFWRGRGPWGPEQLIKMATGQLSDAYGTRLQPPANGDTCETNNALDYRDRAGSVQTPRLGRCTPAADGPRPPLGCSICGGVRGDG